VSIKPILHLRLRKIALRDRILPEDARLSSLIPAAESCRRMPAFRRPQFAKIFVAVALWCAPVAAFAQQILGSGSTFAYPVVEHWSEAYEKISGIHVTYQPIGSAAGITEIKSNIVDFGITDAPLVDAQLLRDGLAQFPVTAGAIVPVVNLGGIAAGQLHFTGRLLADIYLGKVKNWNDAAIAAVNPGIELPDQAIWVVYRSDGSGTTYNWADFLSKVSDEWKIKVGVGTSVAWPRGAGGRGNEGVAQSVAHVKGAIGYIEYEYALREKLTYGLVQNRAGNFVAPDSLSLRATMEGVDWTKERNFYVLLNDAPGAHAYPIMATSFALIRRHPSDVARSRDTLAFFEWVMEHGQSIADSLHHLPLPPSLVLQIEGYWEENLWNP
jgi:phosphate transport system substrate-binding protein